ncbi:hypothetical protein [Flavobacterium sp. ENC]|uniref:hypothetical protein n=1 Tax=Flavobacterium sp. ENC TaxID=2897330 RepID=UPI001E33C873|nr:hypothetical protein [Flavobacterium sp. ENC]MCD0464150.1 hypothetical protein [Flavobacterium sp. ENC]
MGKYRSTDPDGMQADVIILTFQNDTAKTAYENTVNKALGDWKCIDSLNRSSGCYDRTTTSILQ